MLRVVVLLFVTVSVAEATPVHVEISGGACKLEDLEAKLIQLAPDASFRADASTRFSIVTRATDDGVVARIIRGGEREVRAASCDELVDSLALILAMAVRVPAIPADEAPIPLERIDAPPSVPSPSSAWSVLVGGAGSRTSEGWVTRVSAGARWRKHARSLGIEVRASTPMDESVSPVARIRVWDATIAVTPCHHMGALAVCASVASGFIRGTSTGLLDAHNRTSPTLSLGGRVEWTIPIGERLGLRVHLDGDAYLSTTRFEVDQMTRWSHDRIEVRGGFGAVAHFP